MSKNSFRGPLERVDPCCVRIPKSYKHGMKVPGMIYVNDTLLDQVSKDSAPEQVANVAFLPGIQVASIAMPDIHWGYGFCIGGVAATDPAEGGVICPGGIGYDINCLTGDSLVMHRDGYTRRIDELADTWRTSHLACFNLQEPQGNSTRPALWFAQRPKKPVLRVLTEAGDTIQATADHPFWTPRGMIPLGELQPSDRVAISPFAGVPYEPTSDRLIVSEDDVLRQWDKHKQDTEGNGLAQAMNYLRERNILPLRENSPLLPALCRVLGFVFGDGSLHFVHGKDKGITTFYGQAVDLEAIRTDIVQLGFTPSKIYRRERLHAIHTPQRQNDFSATEEHFKVSSTGFALLLAALGAPVGNKAKQDFTAPAWLEAAPRWVKRQFLAALFGAELSAPKTVPKHDTVFMAPAFSVNKRPAYQASGQAYLETIARWLGTFGIETQAFTNHTEAINMAGDESICHRLLLASTTENLIRLWGQIGFLYNQKRAALAAWAVQYLKRKQEWITNRERAAKMAVEMRNNGRRRHEIIATVMLLGVNDRLVERSLDSSRKTTARVGKSFEGFEDYCNKASENLGTSGMVWETIRTITTIPEYDGLVYDFTVEHADHNFVANSFVVSNCGVRLIKTNLSYRDVKNHVRTLITALFNTVPAGVGRSGAYRFTEKEMMPLMERGASYLVGRGLGVGSDLEHMEANGRIERAEPDLVSPHAVKRGSEQCGTLGSGNHFMEVQIVDHVFDAEVAQAFGLEKDQVCVMIHSGSRGLGYQVCEDALVAFRKTPEKYGITLPDKQLACAPAESPEGQRYIGAMRAAANFGFCNRQLLMQQAREVFADVFGQSWQELGMNLLYDVAHNIAKLEEHTVEGVKKKVWVHRKGATRAFPAGHPELPDAFKHIGQPVIIPGDMGRASWILVGMPGSMERTFGTTCHGAGRTMSRTAAVQDAGGRKIEKELEARGVIAMAQSRRGLAEEQPKAYKNVDDVVDVVDGAGLSRKVARMRPIGVIKG